MGPMGRICRACRISRNGAGRVWPAPDVRPRSGHVHQVLHPAAQRRSRRGRPVKRLKLTNRLDAGTVEDLQGLGAGPRTLAALRELITASASLPVAAPVAPPPPPGGDSAAESGRAETDPGGDHRKSARLHQEPAEFHLRASHYAQFRSLRDGILAPARQNPGAAQLRGRQGRLQSRPGEQSAGGEYEARAVGRHHFLGRVRNHAVPDLRAANADPIRLGTLGHAARQTDVRVQLPRGAAQFGLQHLPSAFGPHHRGRISRADLRRRGDQADHADQDGMRRPGSLPHQPGFPDSGLRPHQDLGSEFRAADGGRGALARRPDAWART